MSLNLYDLLDVEETASADEIRAAWKAAIAALEPSDRRFRAYNDAAAVLLDPDKRAAYDADLADGRAAELEEAEEPLVTDPDEPEELPARDPDEPVDDQPMARAAVAATAAPTAADEADASPRTGPPAWSLAVAAVAAVLAVALAVWVLSLPGASAKESPKDLAERGLVQERAAVSAEAAAEKMIAPVLSYDHRTMAEDLARIQGQMTDEMAAKQAAAWPELTKEAELQKVVVEAAPAGTAITRVSPDGKRATVLAFIDQFVEKKGSPPFALRMWATLVLERAEGSDERWLLDDLCTEADCG